MTNHDFDALDKISQALSLTRAEMDGMRVVLIAALATISEDKTLGSRFASTLRVAREAEIAYCLSTPMSDEEMQQRIDWVDRLTPTSLRAAGKP